MIGDNQCQAQVTNYQPYGSESKISIGGDPVWSGAEGIFVVPGHWRVRCGLCVAEKSDLGIGQTDQAARAKAERAGRSGREIEKAIGNDADGSVARGQHKKNESRVGAAAG